MRYCVKGFMEKDISSVNISKNAGIGSIEFSGNFNDGSSFLVDDTLWAEIKDDFGKRILDNRETASLLYASSVVYMAQNDTINEATEDKIRSVILTALRVLLPPFFFSWGHSDDVKNDFPPYVSVSKIYSDADFRFTSTETVSDDMGECEKVFMDKSTYFPLLPVSDEIENIKAMLELCADNLAHAECEHDFKDICYHLDAIKEAYAYLFKAEEIAKETEPIVKIETEYCPSSDTTFLMENTYSALGELKSREVIGFYAGEPNQEDTEFYAQNRSLKAEMG